MILSELVINRNLSNFLYMLWLWLCFVAKSLALNGDAGSVRRAARHFKLDRKSQLQWRLDAERVLSR